MLHIFLEMKLISSVVTIYLSGYSFHTRKYNVSFFRMAQVCEGHVPLSMDLASKQVSKVLINGITIFKDSRKKKPYTKLIERPNTRFSMFMNFLFG